MSNSLLNLRFGSYHFQILKDRPYISFGHNPYQDRLRAKGPTPEKVEMLTKNPNWKWRWFEWME